MTEKNVINEVQVIADAIIDEQASAEQIIQLEKILAEDINAQRFYYEYLDMHMHLSSKADRTIELVYRSLSAEELIVRPVGSHIQKPVTDTAELSCIKPANTEQVTNPGANYIKPPEQGAISFSGLFKYIHWLAITLLVFIIISVSVWLTHYKTVKEPFLAELIQGSLSIVGLGQLNNNSVLAGEYKADQDTILMLHGGDTLHLSTHSVIKLFNSKELTLKEGTLKLTPSSKTKISSSGQVGNYLGNNVGNNIVVRGPSFSLYSNGYGLSLDLNTDKPQIKSGENTLLLPDRWRPKHYWSFNSTNELVLDNAGNAHGKALSGAIRTQGLIGQGAFSFNNSIKARINVGSGGGTELATGSFAVTDGVTIEALIKPKYSGKRGDGDLIFVKSHTDKPLRMMLGFQHDYYKDYVRPEGDFKESLSFGLYVLGQGYHELKLPLDGLNGRPSLASLNDGEIHHVVATYNVSSGIKAIYIDGVQHVFYQYPPGAKILTGGPGKANIGHNPSRPRQPHRKNIAYFNEGFSGVIDEVAFYDFALSSFMIQAHLNHIHNGRDYFGFLPKNKNLPDILAVPLPAHSTMSLSPLTGQPMNFINQ